MIQAVLCLSAFFLAAARTIREKQVDAGGDPVCIPSELIQLDPTLPISARQHKAIETFGALVPGFPAKVMAWAPEHNPTMAGMGSGSLVLMILSQIRSNMGRAFTMSLAFRMAMLVHLSSASVVAGRERELSAGANCTDLIVANADEDSLQACAPVYHGESCSFSCMSGYSPSGPLHCLDGSIGSVECTEDACNTSALQPFLAGVPQAVGSCFDRQGDTPTPSGAFCWPECTEGYTSTGPLRCTRGQFSPVGSVGCVPELPCAVLDGLDWGPGVELQMLNIGTVMAVPQERVTGSRWTVSCRAPRFDSTGTGAQTLVCQAGQWYIELPGGSQALLGAAGSPPSVRCEDQPCSPSALPERGHLTCDGTSASVASSVPMWSTCHLACTEGYNPEPFDLQYACVYTSPAAAAELNNVPVDGNLIEAYNAENVPIDAVAAMIPMRTRLVDRVLTRAISTGISQTCSRVTCPLPTFSQSAVSGLFLIECTGQQYGAVCRPVCDPGWEPSPGAKMLNCSENGHFEGRVACRRTNCPSEPLWPFNASSGMPEADCAGRSHGDFCGAVCKPGYAATPSKDRGFQCEAGQWVVRSEGSPCVQPSCASPPDLQFAVTNPNCAGLASGSSCPVDCIAGYSLDGDVTCEMGNYRLSGMGCVPGASVATAPTNILQWTVEWVVENMGDNSTTAGSSRTMATAALKAREVAVSGVSMEDVGSTFGQQLVSGGASVEDATLLAFAAAQDAGLSCADSVALSFAASLANGHEASNTATSLGQMSTAFGCGAVYAMHAFCANFLTGSQAGSSRRLDAEHSPQHFAGRLLANSPSTSIEGLVSMLRSTLDASSVRVQLQPLLSPARDVAVAGLFAASISKATWPEGQTPSDWQTGLAASRARDAALLAGRTPLEAEAVAGYAMVGLWGVSLDALVAARNTSQLQSIGVAGIRSGTAAFARARQLDSLAAELQGKLVTLPSDAIPYATYAVCVEAGMTLPDAATVVAELALRLACAADTGSTCVGTAARQVGMVVRARGGLAGEAAEAAALATYSFTGAADARLAAAAAGAALPFGRTLASVVASPVTSSVSAGTVELGEEAIELAVSFASISPAVATAAREAVTSADDGLSAALLGVLAALPSGSASIGVGADAAFAAVAEISTDSGARAAARAAARAVLGGQATTVSISRAEGYAAGSLATPGSGPLLDPTALGLAVRIALAGAGNITSCASVVPVALQMGLSQRDASIAALVALGAVPERVDELVRQVEGGQEDLKAASLSSLAAAVSPEEAAVDAAAAALHLDLRFSAALHLSMAVLGSRAGQVNRSLWGLATVSFTADMATCMGAPAEDFGRALARAFSEQPLLPGVSGFVQQSTLATSLAAAAFGLEEDSAELQDVARAATAETSHAPDGQEGDAYKSFLRTFHWDLAKTRRASTAAHEVFAAAGGASADPRQAAQIVLNQGGPVGEAATAAMLMAGFLQNRGAVAVADAGAKAFAQAQSAWARYSVGLMAASQLPGMDRTAAAAASRAVGAVLEDEEILGVLAEQDPCAGLDAPLSTCSAQPEEGRGSCRVTLESATGTCSAYCRDSPEMPRRCVGARQGTCSQADAGEATGCEESWTGGSVLCSCSGALQSAAIGGERALGNVRLLEDAAAVCTLSARLLPFFARTPSRESSTPREAQGAAYLSAQQNGMTASTAIAAVAQVGLSWDLSKEEALEGAVELMRLQEPFSQELLQMSFDLGRSLLQAGSLPATFTRLATEAEDLGEILDQPNARSQLLRPLSSVTAEAHAVALLAAGNVSLEAGPLGISISADVSSLGLSWEARAGLVFSVVLRAGAETAYAVAAAYAASAATGGAEAAAEEVVTLLLAHGLNATEAEALAWQELEEAQGAPTRAAFLAAAARAISSQAATVLSDAAQFTLPPLPPQWAALVMGNPSVAESTVNLDLEWVRAHRNQVTRAMATVLQVQPEQVLLQSALPSFQGQGRRLQAFSLEEIAQLFLTITLSFILSLKPSDSIDDIRQRVLQLGGNSRSLIDQLISELTTAGLEVPVELNSMALSPGAVQHTTNYPLAVSAWMAYGEWSSCPAACGTTQQHRSIGCTTGNDAACDLSPRESTSQDCEDYSVCGFSIICPFGRDNEKITCGEQLAIILTPLGLIALCCMAAVGRKCRRPKEGSAEINGQWVKWHEEEAKEDGGAKLHIVWDIDVARVDGYLSSLVASAEGSKPMMTRADSKPQVFPVNPGDVNLAGGEDYKLAALVLIEHDDASTANAYLLGHKDQGAPGSKRLALQEGCATWTVGGEVLTGRTRLDDGQEHEVVLRYSSDEDCYTLLVDGTVESSGLAPLPDPPVHTLLRDAQRVRRVRWNDLEVGPFEVAEFGSEAEGGHTHVQTPPVQPHERLEYYSSTHSRWVPAQAGDCRRQALDTEPSLVTFGAQLMMSDLRRQKLFLWQVRRPFSNGDLCSFYSKTGKVWLNALALDVQNPLCTNCGYNIRLLEQQEGKEATGLDQVPATRLRWRFPPGCPVEVYTGLRDGWIPGVVQTTCTREEATAAESEDPVGESAADFEIHRGKTFPAVDHGSKAISTGLAAIKGGDLSTRITKFKAAIPRLGAAQGGGDLSAKLKSAIPNLGGAEGGDLSASITKLKAAIPNLGGAEGLLEMPADNLELCKLVCNEFGLAGFTVRAGKARLQLAPCRTEELVVAEESDCYLLTAGSVGAPKLYEPPDDFDADCVPGSCPLHHWVEVLVATEKFTKVVPSFLVRPSPSVAEYMRRAELLVSSRTS